MPDQVTEETEEQAPKRKGRKLLLLGLLLLMLAAGITAALTYHIVSADTAPPVLPPDTLPEVEVRAVPEEDGTGEGGEASAAGGGSVHLSFTDQVEISLADQEARFYLSTPRTSNQSMILDLLIHDTLILRSGGLPPGSRLESLPLLGNAVLRPGGYDGLIRLTFYDPVTGEKAAVDAEIPVQVTVRETFAGTEAP